MELKEIPMANLSLVEIRNGTPHCINHGAMNKVSEGGYWRCLRAISLKTGKVNPAHDCRAGCKYE